ncbi:EF-hand domain-containing protein [Crocosphaera sp. Alani8]|uniref:EF-hand domain-containing protein n=1 Tax=Crocosphaera sp. Alani8 TaxID=3038952 RepID=UPI00313D8E7E
MKIPLNQHQTEELRKFFAQVDQDNNGKIDKKELKQLLETIWGENTDLDINEAVESTFKKCDLNNDGFITFDELTSLPE